MASTLTGKAMKVRNNSKRNEMANDANAATVLTRMQVRKSEHPRCRSGRAVLTADGWEPDHDSEVP